MFEHEFGDTLSQAGRGRFSGDSWEVDFTGDLEAVSGHERIHRQLNELTSFGAVLDAVSRLAREEAGAGRYAYLFRKLVGRARTTHEVFATYSSIRSYYGADGEAQLTGNLEYQQYFRIGDQIVRTAPTLAFGNLVLFALVRIAMNGPLPPRIEAGDFSEIELSEFRAKHAPDHRFRTCRAWLTKEICAAAFIEAKEYFGADKQWRLFAERPEGNFVVADFIKFRTVGDNVEIVAGGPDPRFETDVGNFVLDHLAVRLRDIGITIFSLTQRRELENRIRTGVKVASQRFYDDPDNFADLSRRRDMGRERLRLKAPLPTRVWPVRQTGEDDWACFQRIAREEGECPVYLRSGRDFLDNHAVTDWPTGTTIDPDRPICFLRKKRYLADGSIGLDVAVISEPYQLLAISVQVGGLRLCLSGQMLSGPLAEMAGPWFQFFEGPMDILIDTHPQSIVKSFQSDWEALAWKNCLVVSDGGVGLPFLTIFPVGAGKLTELAFFRPASDAASKATVEAMDPIPIGAHFRSLGVQIPELSEEAQQSVWELSDRLKHTLRRYVDEEAVFRPHTPEEMSHVGSR